MPPKRLVAGLAAVLTGLALAACAGNPQPGDPPPAPVTSLQGEGSPSPEPGGTEAAPQPTQEAPGYPDDAQEYAEEVLAAWAELDLVRLGDLTTAQTQQQLVDETSGLPNMDWTLIRCDGAAGSTYCTFYNDDGDEVRLKITNGKLGGPDACTEAVYQVTPFPNEGKAYVKVLVEAWRDGNRPRMRLLIREEVHEEVMAELSPTHAPPAGYEISDGPPGGAGLHRVYVKKPGWDHFEFQVGTTLLGGPEAVRDAFSVVG